MWPSTTCMTFELPCRCQRISTDEESAIKVYPKGASAQEAQSVEVKVLQTADRDRVPNVPKVIAHGEQNGNPWMLQT